MSVQAPLFSGTLVVRSIRTIKAVVGFTVDSQPIGTTNKKVFSCVQNIRRVNQILLNVSLIAGFAAAYFVVDKGWEMNWGGGKSKANRYSKCVRAQIGQKKLYSQRYTFWKQIKTHTNQWGRQKTVDQYEEQSEEWNSRWPAVTPGNRGRQNHFYQCPFVNST